MSQLCPRHVGSTWGRQSGNTWGWMLLGSIGMSWREKCSLPALVASPWPSHPGQLGVGQDLEGPRATTGWDHSLGLPTGTARAPPGRHGVAVILLWDCGIPGAPCYRDPKADP